MTAANGDAALSCEDMPVEPVKDEPLTHTAATQCDDSREEVSSLRLQVQRMDIKLREKHAVVYRLCQEHDTLAAKRSSFGRSNKRVKFDTGLATLQIIRWVVGVAKQTMIKRVQQLSIENLVLMIFMKIRLSLSNANVAQRFSLHATTVCSIYRSTLPIISQCHDNLIT